MDFIPVCQPFLDGEENKYVSEAVKTGWISSSGEYVKRFEEEFANYCEVKYATTVCNGTVALHLALVALGIGKGDEVILTNFTMVASVFSICYTGAMPVFVDANPADWNIDVDKIEEKISKKTKAIMAVSMFGHPCNMDKINELAKKYKLKVIEDAAESIGAEYKGKKTGNLAEITTFSFFANKNLTTGEGGMVVTNDPELDKKLKYYKNMCFSLDGPRDYKHEDIGFNYRMSNLIAAVGLAQVEEADYYRALRVHNGKLYRRYLKDVPGILFQVDSPDVVNVYWMNAILLDPKVYGRSRDELIAHLKKNGIDTRLLFTGLNKQPSLKKYGCDVSGKYPVTDNLTENGLYLPSASNLTKEQIEYISDVIKNYQLI